MDAEDSCAFRYVRVRDLVPPPQLWYQPKTAKVKVVEFLRLRLVHFPGLRSIQHRRQDDRFVRIEHGAGLKTVTIPEGVLRATEVLAGFGVPAGSFVVYFGVAREGVTQIVEAVHSLHLGAVHVNTEAVAGGGEEVHGLLHVPICGGAESAIVGEENFLDGGCAHTRLQVHFPMTDELGSQQASRLIRSIPAGELPHCRDGFMEREREVEIGADLHLMHLVDGGVRDGEEAIRDAIEVLSLSPQNLRLLSEQGSFFGAEKESCVVRTHI
ncbi:hypothetical protein SprV_0401488400 [Sparganum proliferum]